MTETLLLASTFILVFALGFQSLNVNGGHYWLAFLTSLVIGVANLVLFKLAPNATTSEMAAFLSGGPFGIVASMWVHRRFVGRERQVAAELAHVHEISPIDVRTQHRTGHAADGSGTGGGDAAATRPHRRALR
jgi:hypothetical protein